MTPVVTMRSSEAKDAEATMVKPKWENAYEANRGRYEVVQTPILTRGRIMFVDAETHREFEKARGQKFLRNAARMVVRKDLKTGEIRSFITVFVGSLEYLKKSKRMGRNSYLYREPDFDGKVLFFKPNGGLINGWKYRNGKIVAKIMPLSEDAKFLITRGWVEECYTETITQWDEECYENGFVYEDEEWGDGFGVEAGCIPIEYTYDVQVCDWVEEEDIDDDEFYGDVDPELPDECDGPKCPVCGKIIADDVLTRSSTVCETCDSKECPFCQKRHCKIVHDACDSIPNSERTKTRVKEVYKKMDQAELYGQQSVTFAQFEELLRTNASNENSVTLYYYEEEDKYLLKNLHAGNSSSSISVHGGESHAIATIHNHPNGTIPSGIDLIVAAGNVKENMNFELTYVYTSDYIYTLQIEDKNKAIEFYEKYADNISDISSSSMFAPGSTLDKQWNESVNTMKHYTGENKELLALANFLKNMDSGFSVSRFDLNNDECEVFYTYNNNGKVFPIKCK